MNYVNLEETLDFPEKNTKKTTINDTEIEMQHKVIKIKEEPEKKSKNDIQYVKIH